MPRPKTVLTKGEFLVKLSELTDAADPKSEEFYRLTDEIWTLRNDTSLKDMVSSRDFPPALAEAILETHRTAGEAMQALKSLKKLLDFVLVEEEAEEEDEAGEDG